eukprot:Em0008g34a
MSILKYLVKQSNPTQDSSTAISLPVNARVSQSSIEEAECEDAHDMELVHSSSARRVADPASELLACTSEFRCVSTFGGEGKSNEQSSAGNKDDAIPDVRILPSKPNQPKLNFPLRCFGKQRRGFSVHWYEKYPWLHYFDNEDAVLCFYCATAVKYKMPLTGYVDSVFTKCGFNNWKKAIDKFAKHEKSESHCHAVSIKVAKLILVMPATNAVSPRYSGMQDLKELESHVPSSSEETPIHGGTTPLSPSEWEVALRNHPDREFADYICTGIRHGFRIGFSRSKPLRSTASNMFSATVETINR